MTTIHVQRIGRKGIEPDAAFAKLTATTAVLLIDADESFEGGSRSLVLIRRTGKDLLLEAQGPTSVGLPYLSSLLAQKVWVLLFESESPRQ
jgi:hypothetical protein